MVQMLFVVYTLCTQDKQPCKMLSCEECCQKIADLGCNLQAYPAEMAALLDAACRRGQETLSRASGMDPGRGDLIAGSKPQLVFLGATMPPEAVLEEAVHKARLRLIELDWLQR